MLERTKENRYRHYKGDIYYKIGEPFTITNSGAISSKLQIIEEIPFKFETTNEEGIAYKTDTGVLFIRFKNREATKEEYKTNWILYISEEGNLSWVRSKEEFEGFNEQGIKRFTLANA